MDGSDQQALQALRQVGPSKELDRVPILVRPFTEMHLPEVGRELGLLVPPARDVPVGRDDLPPWLEAGGGSAFDSGARLPAPLPARLLVEAYPQQLHLEPLELIRLRRRNRGEKPTHRVERPIGVIAGEALLVGPLVAVTTQLTDQTPFRRPENPPKDVVPGLPHQLEQPGHVPLGRGLVRQHRILGVVAKLERVEISRLKSALDLPIDERTQPRLEQVQRLADPFVIRYRHLPRPLSKVFYLNVTPVFFEILRYQTSMAVMGLVLAAKQACESSSISGLILSFDSTIRHQVDKATLVVLPSAALLLVCVQHFLCRSKTRNVRCNPRRRSVEESRQGHSSSRIRRAAIRC